MENIHAHAIRRQVELGISIELDPAVAHDLRQQEEKRRRKQRDSRAGEEQPQQQQQQQDDNDDDDDFDRLVFHYQNEEEEDDWNHVIQTIENAAATTGRETTIVPPGGNESDDNVGEAYTDDEQEEKSDKDEDDTTIPVAVEITDEISLAPDDPMASSLPVVLVNIERLVGYTPSSREQVECLKLQIQSALYGQQPSNDDDDDNDNEENTDPTTTVTAAATGGGGGGGRTRNYDPDGDTTRCDDDFDTRLVEMFTNKSAHHSDTVRVAKLQQQLQEQQQQQQQFSFAVIPYPDLLCRKPPAPHNEDPLEEEAATVVYTTRQIWKSLLKRHVVPVVNRLLQHLRNCSQSLLWKHDMRREILHLVRSQNRQLQQDKLDAWRGTRRGTRGGGTATGAEAGAGTSGLRREKLEKLYHVREMFVHSLDIAQEHLDTLDRQREVAVQQTLLRLRQSQRTDGHAAIGGVEALDFATTSVLTFPTQQEMNQRLGGMSSSKISNSLIIGLQGDDDDDDDVYAEYDDAYYDDDYVPISSDDDDDGDDDECDDLSQNSDNLSPMPETTGLLEPDVDGGATTDTVATVETTTAAADEVMTSGVDDAEECVDHFLSERVATRQSRRQAARQRRLQELATANEEEYRSKLEAAKKEEERAREACTTHEHKIAMAKVHCFQDRLTSVDNLLESLQEDEWADEETTEGEEASGRVSVIGKNSGTIDDDEKGGGEDCRDLTLLDQVLITILGSIRVPMGTRAADHAAWLRTEHLEIVADWKKLFGSLPPSLKRLSSPPTGLDEHDVGASSSSPLTSKFDSSVAFQARVAPFATEATAVRSVEEQASTTQAAWRAGTSSNPQQNVSESRAAHEIRQSLGIEDNEAEDWDA
jgi:hypothetical protein